MNTYFCQSQLASKKEYAVCFFQPADRASSQSGRDQERLNLPYAYTGIWWYASYPNHYAGDGSSPNKEIGE